MKNSIVFLFLMISLFFSCDPVFYIDYYILNSTDGNIKIIYEFNLGRNEFDTAIIESKKKLFLVNHSAIGSTSRNYLASLDSIYLFKSLQIFNSKGSKYIKDPFSIKSWHRMSKGDEGTVELDIRTEDF
ncbi:MAG: hypothetical protein LKG19_09570 [Saprospiraceae bacterium]|jgi:hypothetical protein|nr:hypothetical protein [Saprospiraceae bacterium]